MKEQLSSFRPVEGGFTPPTPFYLYSEIRLKELMQGFRTALEGPGFACPVDVRFAMKSNHNPHVLRTFRDAGWGLDLVSGGELRWALRHEFAPGAIVLSGVGKTRDELSAALSGDVGLINVESVGELKRLSALAKALGKRAPVALRVNPDVDAKTHPYISTGLSAHKFGVALEDAFRLYLEGAKDPNLEWKGVSLHIGSQLMDLGALDEALAKTTEFAARLKREGVSLKILDAGGGLGVDYRHPDAPPNFAGYGDVLARASKGWSALQGPEARMITECGRALVAQAGALVTRVVGTKTQGAKAFAILDASMTELLRPSLYQAWHPIDPWGASFAGRPHHRYDVVGPVCESSDVIGTERDLPELQENDLVMIGCAGAYGYTMASTYNRRGLPAEWWAGEKSNGWELSRAARECDF